MRFSVSEDTVGWWPVNDEPLNTFGTLELLFPISKKDFFSFFPIPNTIIRNFLLCTKMHHLDMILFCSNMNRSFMSLPHLAHHCALFTCNILLSELPNSIFFIKQYFQIKINNLQ